MPNNIGSASLVLSTSAGKLYDGLSEAGGRITAWSSSVSSSVAGALGGAGGGFGAALGGIKSFASSALDSVRDAVGSVVDRIKELGDVGRRATAYGLSPDTFMALTAQARKFGVEGDGLTHMFARLSTEIQNGNPQLARLGVNFQQLRQMDPGEQFITVADAISHMGTQGEKTAAAMGIFGREGASLLPMLTQGRDKMEAFRAKALEMGTALSSADMQIIEEARSAIPKFASIFEGFKNKLAVAFAPLVSIIGPKIQAVFDLMVPVFDRIARAAKVVGTVLSQLFTDVWNGITKVVGGMFDWAGGWNSLMAKMPSVETITMSVLKAIGKGVAYVIDTLKAVGGAVTVGFGYLVEVLGIAMKGLAALIEVGTELPSSMGGDLFRSMAMQVHGWGDEVEKASQKMKNWGVEQIGAWGEGARKVDAWFATVREKGREAASDVKEQLIAAIPDDLKTPGTIMKGSREDVAFGARGKNQELITKANEQIKELNKLNGAMANNNQKLDDIKRQLEKQNGDSGVM